MSIDYDAVVSRDFSVQSFVDDVHEVLNELGVGEASIGAMFWPMADDLGPGRPGLTDGLDRWMCGPGFEDRWIKLTLAPNAQVDIGIISNDDPEDDPADRDPTAWLQATASFRTPESIVVAIASVIAATRVGHGRFEEVRDATIHAGVTPQELIDRLRVRVPVADFAAGARMMLRAMPEYATWSALHDPPAPTHDES